MITCLLHFVPHLLHHAPNIYNICATVSDCTGWANKKWTPFSWPLWHC